MEHEKNICDEVQTMMKITYLGNRVSVDGGCEAAVNVRTIGGWATFRECGELLYGRRFPPRLKGTVCMSYARPAMLHRCEGLYLRE